jgi:hypothetical protein
VICSFDRTHGLIAWRADDGHVLMTGPVATAFTGVFDLTTC